MSLHLPAILDGVLVGAVALGLGFWQLWSLSRERRRDRDKSDRERDA